MDFASAHIFLVSIGNWYLFIYLSFIYLLILEMNVWKPKINAYFY